MQDSTYPIDDAIDGANSKNSKQNAGKLQVYI